MKLRPVLSLGAIGRALSSCASDEDCSLNGLCSNGHCVCDAPWGGDACETLEFLPGKETACGKLCAYHGTGADTTSWGASVVRAREDGLLKYYMFVAQMTHGCTLGQWRSNSEVVLATAADPLGPFEYAMDVVRPWAHNPQVIVAPDADAGAVYALYALGDGVPVVPEENCTKRRRVAARNATANFTIHWAPHPRGPWRAHVARIEDWPTNWDEGARGNWNPAPMVHPVTKKIYLMAHTFFFAGVLLFFSRAAPRRHAARAS